MKNEAKYFNTFIDYRGPDGGSLNFLSLKPDTEK